MKILKFEQLPNVVANLTKEVKEMKTLLLLKTHSKPELDNPLCIKDVAQLTGLTVPTLYGYCQRKEIPYYKKGNRLYFFRENILEWIKKGKQKTIKELQEEAEERLSTIKK